jgi:hypothetical protein
MGYTKIFRVERFDMKIMGPDAELSLRFESASLDWIGWAILQFGEWIVTNGNDENVIQCLDPSLHRKISLSKSPREPNGVPLLS